MDLLAPLIVGWPGATLALVLALAGLLWKRPWLAVVGTVLFTPFCLYVTGNPRVSVLVRLLPLFLLGEAWLIRAGRKPLAWILLAVPVLATLSIAWMVWNG